MDITGTIIAILPAQSGISQRTGSTWMKQDYVLEVPGTYPKRVCFGIFGEDRIKQFDLHQGEQNITVQFDVDAHEYQGRWYNEIRAYNIIRPYQQQPVAQQAPVAYPPSVAEGGFPAANTAPFPPKQEALPF